MTYLNMKISIISIILVLFLSGCSFKSNFDILPKTYGEVLNSDNYKEMPGIVEGSSADTIFFIFPLSFGNKEEATRRAIESRLECIAIVNGTWTQTIVFLPPIFFLANHHIKGTCFTRVH